MTGLSLSLLCVLVCGVLSEPTPGRIPKVYNALITSNQNLEPSKAYPVYQPVLHDTAFTFPFQPAVFYGGDFPLSNGLLPPPGPTVRDPNPTPSKPPPPAESPTPETLESSTEAPSSTEPSEQDTNKQATPAPPLPPNTQSPIPLNEFGLPSQVLPLGRFDPTFNGFTQIGPFTYPYPGIRFYDPYDPFSLSPYANFPPLYRPVTNVLSQGPPIGPPPNRPLPVPSPSAPAPSEQTDGSPPPEPSDLNVLNYSSKDPAIPNVPPPPLPSGGLQSDKSQ